MSELEKKICEYGQKQNIKALQALMSNTDLDKLPATVQSRIRSPVFTNFWNYLLQSFTDSSESHRKRYEIVSSVLQELEKGGLSTSQSTNIVVRLCGELPKFKSTHLINLASFCIEFIQKGNVTGMCWKDLLPEILNVLEERECVSYNDTDMTGLEYKNQLINSLCMMTWSPNIVTSLATMFVDAPLNKEEHLKVVNKLGQYMEKLTCQEIPSFIYQLLKLCRKQHSQSVFLRLQYYFGMRIYSKANILQDSDSMDIIGDGNDQEAIDVESTVLFHIYQNALLGHDIIKDYLSSLKLLQKSPEFILHPFQLTVLLTISSLRQYEEIVMDILKSSISRAINEESKMCESYWFREMVPSVAKVNEVFKQIIEYSIPNRHLVIKGLVQLSYVLLGYSPMLHKDAEDQWNLGKLIVLKIIKKKTDIAPCIIKSLGNFLVTSQNPYQFIDCIYIICHKMSFVVLENQSCISYILDYLDTLPGPAAVLLFDAVLPLAKLSPTIRDRIIILLRKALYSRTTDKRQLAATGFVKLIRNLKINNMAALSQSSSSSSFSSGISIFTQVSLTCTGRMPSSSFSNEALCLEVLDILKRCFMQQAEVRVQFYNGLYDAICMNPELSIPILDVMWNHFSNFYVKEADELPPLYFSKICVTHDLTVTLQEPLGKLIYTIGLLIAKTSEENENEVVVVQFKEALESLCTRMINCELINFELDDGSDLLNGLPDSQEKLFILKEAMCVCEALIGYKICSWNPNSENNAQQINSLFQSYNRLLTFSKNLTKPKKLDKKKKGEHQNKTTQQTQNTTKTDGGVKAIKAFTIPDTIMDFQTVGKVLQLLHKTSVDWAPAAQANIIKSKCEIHRFIMQATIQLVHELKLKKTIEVQHSKVYYNYIVEIAAIIYNRCIVRLDTFIDFDGATAVLAVECFYAILTVISMHYKSLIEPFVKVMVGKDEDFVTVLMAVFQVYEKILESDDIESSTDADLKKLQLIVVNTLNLLVPFIPTKSNVLSVHVLEWLKNYMNNYTLSNRALATAFFSLMLSTYIKFKSSEKLFETLAMRLGEVLGTLNKETPNSNEPKIIDSVTAPIVFPILCNNIKLMLDDLDWIILRLRGEYAMITYPGEDNPERRREYLKGKEKCVCSRLCPIISIITILTNTAVPPGNLSEALLKIIAHLYNTLNSLTKYFIMRSSKINLVFQGALFERVVKMCGKHLTNMVYDFIMYIEEFNKEKDAKTQTKKKVDTATLKTKVLKETRPIPKVIFEIEQFGKSVIQLSNKTKVNLSKFIGQGTARDFRIKGLQDVLKKSDQTVPTQNDDTTIDEEEEQEENPDENNSDEVAENDDDTDEGPNRKKRKT